MGLSDRFDKKKTATPSKKVEKKSEYPSHTQLDAEMLEDIECMVLNKIAYTPVWFEFSNNEQKKLIKAYLNARLELPENSTLILTEEQKDAFVTKILASV